MNAEQTEPGILIRKAIADDAAQVAAILEESFAEYKSSYTVEAYAATTPASGEIQNRITAGTVWVALSNGRVVGTVSAVAEGEDIYIRSMAVLPEARGRKVGELLLNQIEDFARAHGYERMTLSTTPFLDRAIRLYERCGFRRSDEAVDDLFGTPLFTMVKTIERE